MRLERERRTLALLGEELHGGALPHILARLICSGHDRDWLRLVRPACPAAHSCSLAAHGCGPGAHRCSPGAHGCSLRCPRLQVLPACLGGDLSDLLEAEGRLDEEQGRFYAGCVILALRCLHGLGIVYRDLKPENILLTAEGWPVLTDFGLVAFLDDGRATSMVGGTPPSPRPEPAPRARAPRSHPELAPRDRAPSSCPEIARTLTYTEPATHLHLHPRS